MSRLYQALRDGTILDRAAMINITQRLQNPSEPPPLSSLLEPPPPDGGGAVATGPTVTSPDASLLSVFRSVSSAATVIEYDCVPSTVPVMLKSRVAVVAADNDADVQVATPLSTLQEPIDQLAAVRSILESGVTTTLTFVAAIEARFWILGRNVVA